MAQRVPTLVLMPVTWSRVVTTLELVHLMQVATGGFEPVTEGTVYGAPALPAEPRVAHLV